MYEVVGNGTLHDIFQRGAQGDRAPGGLVRQTDGSGRATMTIEFAGLRETDLVVRPTLVQQATTDIRAIGTGLGDEQPTLLAVLEQTGEAVTLAPAVLTHLVVEGVAGLVAGRGTGETTHRLRLRTEEGGGSLGHHKS